MSRRLFTICTVVSASVFVFTIGLIVRTQIATDKIAMKYGRAVLIESHPKHLLIFVLIAPADAGHSFGYERLMKEHALPEYSELRFSVQRGSSTWLHVALPFWLILLLAAPLPAWMLARRFHWRRRAVAGMCRACGYDLRATPDRCPECGQIAAAKSLRPDAPLLPNASIFPLDRGGQ